MCRHVDLVQNGIWPGDQLLGFLHDGPNEIERHEGDEEHQCEGEGRNHGVHLELKTPRLQHPVLAFGIDENLVILGSKVNTPALKKNI